MRSRKTPSWLEEAIGVSEDAVHTLKQSGTILHTPKGALDMGHLSIPRLCDLRDSLPDTKGGSPLSEATGDVAEFHRLPEADGALFQVASQFNLLEMPGPNVVPEAGVSGYEFDWTQGPACAMATPGGLLYRHYFYPFQDGKGQTATRQIDCARDLHDRLETEIGHSPWGMTNGYLFPNPDAGASLYRELQASNGYYRGLLRVGFHRDMQVAGYDTKVSHVYASAIPNPQTTPEPLLAKLILEAAYEATFAAACHNYAETGNRRLYLTRIGGGAFRNPPGLIDSAIRRAARLYEGRGLVPILITYK